MEARLQVPSQRLKVPDENPPVDLPSGVVLGPLRLRYTRDGEMHFREISIPLPAEIKIHSAWKANKLAFYARGYTMRSHEGGWHLGQWLRLTTAGWELTPTGDEIYRNLLTPEELPIQFEAENLIIDSLPNDLEKFLRGYQVQPSRQVFRALANGFKEWGYAGAADLSDMGVGKTYMDLAAALATGRKPLVLCPSVGADGWQRAFDHFGATPHYIGTYEAVRGGFRQHIAGTDETGRFYWKNAGEIVLILDEAQALRHDDTLTVACCSAAIRQGIPIIVASATIATSPLEMRFAGRITGLHQGRDDWTRFLLHHGCSKKNVKSGWVWDQKLHHLSRIHHQLFPRRGCRVKKEDLGEECPETIIEVLSMEIEESAVIEAEWKRALAIISSLQRQGESAGRIRVMENRTRMATWQKMEGVLVPYIAKRVREDVRGGNSVALFMNFNESRLHMSRLLGTNAGFYGGQNKERRKYWEREFQADRERILVNNIRAGGASVSLHDVRGDHPRISYIFPTDRVVDMEQATGRVDRVGGQSISRQFIPCVSGSITQKMVERTRRKMLGIATLNNGADDVAARF